MTHARGTSNSNDRGNVHDRRRRREYLVDHYRADVDLYINGTPNFVGPDGSVRLGTGAPACRCYRCGALLTVETVTVDRRIPGCEGGTYWDLMNLRPACSTCNSSTGGMLGAARRNAS